MSPPKTKYQIGFTFIELLIATFIISTAITGVFGLFVLSLRLAQESERRLVAIALANERVEMIRNLPYVDVGTVGGVPAGVIAQEENIARNNTTYTVKTDIRFIDDAFDGLAEEGSGECVAIAHFPPGDPAHCNNLCVSPSALRAHIEHGDYVGTCTGGPSGPDVVNTDYKQVRVEVSWPSPNEAKPLLLISQVAPEGVEGGDLFGTLDLNIINSQGTAVPSVNVNLINNALNPIINISTQTDAGGSLVLPGLPESFSNYELAVTKPSYTSEQTYTITPDFVPDTDHGHLSLLVGDVTNKTFVIDLASRLTINFTEGGDSVDTYCLGEPPQAIAGQEYALQGTKTIGVDGSGEPVLMYDYNGASDSSGLGIHENLVWDSYDLTLSNTTACDIKETSLVVPVTINPGDDLTLTARLVKHTPISLRVTVTDADGAPVDNTAIHLTGNGFDDTQSTGEWGQVIFSDLPVNADYTLDISSPGFTDEIQSVTVENTTRVTVDLAPL